jgi:hypothetical protein
MTVGAIVFGSGLVQASTVQASIVHLLAGLYAHVKDEVAVS